MAPKRLTAVRKDQPFHNVGDQAQACHDRSPAKVNDPSELGRAKHETASAWIQHVVRLVVKKSTYSREQNLNQAESAIRRRFVPDSFQRLISSGILTMLVGAPPLDWNIPLSLRV
ncbi:hypothetical protein EN836_00605 [Mesorhizobium sp. M1C.F.Ca.ET.193.01.1.1]|uniref:hypothetical protein n=1 Tax=unclassified Mesorhizobium TaxID=325217 RepID=UPI000FDBA049|nr:MULTISPECIES: hypothetical protein [unclassified Mesorhizobium]TGR14286.1 hypothetical protein EN847_00605 [Mesorhizobium sp. M1C.F.Ca.ET.204.01.1.1]TGR85916.1 hypothetical protein EN832_00605 [Mesorhizobium sp. M1C.F.Ca.ET.189.01.1.1]TGR88399.1 hypothetical protein EN836_00605 [Mesorhizobium sp. M1C.F.Ca.ET.193.01.1.1]TGU84659.1 hypothetical protein EN787_00605 [Mesorhizobium sp. M1C.F.Ca.ET.144.01.1.1]TGQ75903.1 hypothetical protein EN855_000605 [Mesorhizobium sp. M1C.F.Ca.ET.212.01.1.1]